MSKTSIISQAMITAPSLRSRRSRPIKVGGVEVGGFTHPKRSDHDSVCIMHTIVCRDVFPVFTNLKCRAIIQRLYIFTFNHKEIYDYQKTVQ